MQQIKINHGFTLIELMVTIAVMAIIATIAAPSFGNMIAEKRLESDTRELALILGDARGQAATLRKNITIKFEIGTNTSTIYYWMPKYPNIQLDNKDNEVDFSDVIFTPVGIPKQRTKLIDNTVCKVIPPTPNPCFIDPINNPLKVEQILPLKFKLCNSKIGKSRIINVSLNGTIQQIEKGECSKNE